MEHRQIQNFRGVCRYTGKFREVRGPQIPSTGRKQNLRKNHVLSCAIPFNQY